MTPEQIERMAKGFLPCKHCMQTPVCAGGSVIPKWLICRTEKCVGGEMVRSPENWQEYNFAVVGEELVEHVAHAIDHYRQTTMPEYHTPRNYAKAAIAAMDKDGEVERLREALEAAEYALRRVKDWCDAYPEDIFVPPTKEQWKQSHEHFKTLGFSIDKISGEYGRIWAKGQRPHVEAALKTIEALNPKEQQS